MELDIKVVPTLHGESTGEVHITVEGAENPRFMLGNESNTSGDFLGLRAGDFMAVVIDGKNTASQRVQIQTYTEVEELIVDEAAVTEKPETPESPKPEGDGSGSPEPPKGTENPTITGGSPEPPKGGDDNDEEE